jgi:hypothetical protein
MTGPAGLFSRPFTRWVMRQVILTHHRQKSIQTLAQAMLAARDNNRIGMPKRAMIVDPTYQPTLKRSERSRRPSIVCPLLVA